MHRKIVKINKIPNDDLLLDLLELMLYRNLSYCTGQRGLCSVTLDDKHSIIYTPETIYKLSDEVYVQIYLLSNKVLANVYKIVKDDKEI